MYRYLALIWNPADGAASAAARSLLQAMTAFPPGWQRALEAAGVVVFHCGLNEGASETRLLDGASGVVLGRIFSASIESTAAARAIGFDAAETQAIVSSGGQRLCERYWGRYVAIFRDPGGHDVSVLRDPLGQLPCLLASFKAVHIVFSDLEDCLRLTPLPLTVNWEYIAVMLANPSILSSQTALREVAEIQPGERVRFTSGGVQRAVLWRAFQIARRDRIQSVTAAAQQLRATTRACIHAWASCYQGVLHNLSGGLDSSIVLSCLKEAPTHPAITCLNYYGTGPSEDERQFARLMARHAGVELIEHRLDPSEVDLQRLTTLRRSARPWFYLYELEHGELESQLARQRGAGSLFSGAGGDGIFYQARPDLAVIDYLFDHGLGSGLLSTAVDAAQVARRSIWPLLLKALRARILPRRFNLIAEAGRGERSLIAPDVLEAAIRSRSFEHAWFSAEATRGVSPGILWHVSTVSVPPAYYPSFGPELAPERTLPLLSQPLVELCLRTPSYLLIASGRDRALARRAFAADLPETTVKRTAKGRIDHYLRNVMDRNLQFVREFLLEGVLVSRGLLNRENLEMYLSRERSPADFQYAQILQEYLCVEAWLRRWLP